MKSLFILLISILIVQNSVAPPVQPEKKKEEEHKNEVDEAEVQDIGDIMEYHRYLQEVVQALESDPDFRSKLEKANETDIRTGKIAHELEFVNHHVRNKLDELKRTELERLRHLATQEYELQNGINRDHLKIPEHLDHQNPHTFEIDDLKKLIAKTTKDLDEADKKRKEQFKEYEMNKKYEQEEKMKTMQEEEKKKYEQELHELEKKHKEHEPLHHPGSKKQYEEVWEKQDHMEDQEFDPKAFFYLHDLDGNGVWDQVELKALFVKELDKLYAQGHPEDDLVERAEELERMREHVIKEADLNKDGFISYDEFINESKKAEFEQDSGWETLDEQQLYSEQEYETYKTQKAREIERAIAKGMSEQHAGGHPQNGHEQFPPHPNEIPHHNNAQQQAQYQHNQVPQQQQQHNPQQGQYANQVPPQQMHYDPNQHQQGQFQQVPQQHVQYQQAPPQQGQYQQGQYQQIPPQQAQYQQVHPQQGQYQQAQPQQGQYQQAQPQQGQYQQAQPQQGQYINQMPPQQQQQQQLHPNQVYQAPISNDMNQHQNYPPTNQQVPAGQVPQQHQQQNVPSMNQNHQQNIPTANQPAQGNSNTNQGQQASGAQIPVVNAPQQNTQNQVPHEHKEQIASINAAHGHA
ncbi:hypothetical protein TKK_0001131 [Trichogramma kaykai]|uniref:EF-hand domain-containing protein n=1 Tax=Trichogramma kaykai TaxID=54128 RepID=A0ABD2WST8_9HYME